MKTVGRIPTAKLPALTRKRFPPVSEPETDNEQGKQQGIREGKRKSNDPETDVRQSQRNTVPMTGTEDSYRSGRRGSTAHATRRREGEAGHDVLKRRTAGGTLRPQTV
jgi:hypothetical protein